MKKAIVLLLATVCTAFLIQWEKSVTLQFVEKYSPSFNASYANSSILPKQERLSSNAGDLNATYDENMGYQQHIQGIIRAEILRQQR